MNRFDLPFQPIVSSHTSFDMILSTASSAVELESSGRIWSGPGSRSIRISESSGVEYRMQIGSSLVEAAAATCPMMLGGVAEIFTIYPRNTYIALMTTSTAISNVSVTLGYGA